jgi:DNA-damage-inducible protein J
MAQLSMRIDDNVKRKAELACKELGLTMTAAINLYLVKLGNEMRIPFEVSVDPFYNPENQRVLEKSIQQLNAGKGTIHDLIEVEDE